MEYKNSLIIVAGGSASGKTTVVQEIKEKLASDELVVISHDDYYKDQSELTLEQRALTNYDHPEAYDDDLMISQLKDLLNGKSINKPTYDFVLSTRKNEIELIQPGKVILLEGILTLNNKLLRQLANINIFVESDDDVRLIRRIKRDMIERQRSFDSIINQYVNIVKPMHHAFVKPSKRFADIIILNDTVHDVAVDLVCARISELIKK